MTDSLEQPSPLKNVDSSASGGTRYDPLKDPPSCLARVIAKIQARLATVDDEFGGTHDARRARRHGLEMSADICRTELAEIEDKP